MNITRKTFKTFSEINNLGDFDGLVYVKINGHYFINLNNTDKTGKGYFYINNKELESKLNKFRQENNLDSDITIIID